MAVIKQRTVNGDTYKLKKAETQKSGKQFEYYLTKNDSIVTDPVYTKRDAMSQFDGVTNRAAQGDDKLGEVERPSGFFGGGGGMMGHGGDDDDDNGGGPLPW